MNRLNAYIQPQEITRRTSFNGVIKECSNFIYFPPANGKNAFLLIDEAMCDRKTQTIHLGFDIDPSSDPFSLSLMNSNIIEIPKR
jgi:hypothetical protein